MITTSAELDGADLTALTDEDLILAVLLADHELGFCDAHDPCEGQHLQTHLRRDHALFDEVVRRWSKDAATRLSAYGDTRRRAVADELLALARHQPEVLLAVARGEAPAPPPPGTADQLLAEYRRQRDAAHGYRDRAHVLEQRDQNCEGGVEAMTLTALHEAADVALHDAADAAEAVLMHMLTVGELPAAVAGAAAHARSEDGYYTVIGLLNGGALTVAGVVAGRIDMADSDPGSEWGQRWADSFEASDPDEAEALAHAEVQAGGEHRG